MYDDIAQLLLDHGANPDEQNEYGWTSLHVTSERGRVKVVQLLLDRGANVNTQSMDLRTPLHRAAYYGRLQVAKVLLEHGADLHIRDEQGKTPSQLVLKNYYNELAQLLSERTSEGT